MHNIRVSNEILHRIELANLLNAKNFNGIGCEIGVHRGQFAAQFLHAWNCTEMILIDHYTPCHDFPDAREVDEKMARAALEPYRHVTRWVKENSVIALRGLADESLDFCYIDGGHRYWEVDPDIKAAWPKMKSGGLLAGHDFMFQLPEVARAVKELSIRENVEVWITTDFYEPWSWYCWKP